MMIGMPQAQSTPQAGISSDFILPPFSRQGWRGSVRQIALAGEAECQQLGTPVSPPRLHVTTAVIIHRVTATATGDCDSSQRIGAQSESDPELESIFPVKWA